MKSNTTRLLARNVFHLGIGQVASTALGILLTMVLGRALGPSDFGILYTVLAIASFVAFLSDWGQSTYLIREMARGRPDEPELIGTALLMRLGLILCSAAVAGATAVIMGYSEQIVTLAVLSVVVGIPATLYAPLGFKFRGKDRMDADAFANIAGKAVMLIATVMALHFGGKLTEVVLAQGIGSIATLLLGVIFALLLGFQIKGPKVQLFRELFIHGAPIAAFSLVLASQPFVEIMMLSAFAGAAVVGWYGASRTIFGIISSPATIMMTAFFPELSRASLSLPDFRRTIDATARVLFIAAAFTASFLYLFADHMVSIIYGPGRFEQSAAILRASAVFVPLLFFVLLLGAAMSAIGRNNAMVAISIVRVLVCAVLGWILIGYFQQRYGNGAIVLVVIAGLAEIPAVIACLFLLPKGAVGKATILNLGRACVAAVCTVLPFYLMQPLPLWYLVPLFMLSFGVFALATRLVVPKDLHLALDIVRNGMLAFRRPRAEITPGA